MLRGLILWFLGDDDALTPGMVKTAARRLACIVGFTALTVTLAYAAIEAKYALDLYMGDGTDGDAPTIVKSDGQSDSPYITFLASGAGLQTYSGGNSSYHTFDVGQNSDVLKITATNIQMSQSFTATGGGTFQTIAPEFTAGLETDDIVEDTGAAGVTIDSVLLKDGTVTLGASGPVLSTASGAGASCAGSCVAGSLCADTDGDDGTDCGGGECFLAVCEGSSTWAYLGVN
jgi:hypothetical protein